MSLDRESMEKAYWDTVDKKTGRPIDGTPKRIEEQTERRYEEFLEFLHRAVHEGRLVYHLQGDGPLDVHTGPLDTPKGSYAGWKLG